MNAKADLTQRATDYIQHNGVNDQSLRAIAAGIGTSHRMLIYHFGSRDGLIGAVVDGLWGRLRHALAEIVRQHDESVAESGWRLWSTVVEAEALAPIFFELSAPAMRDAPWAVAFREGSVALTAQLALLLERAGQSPQHADHVARLTMYVVRGALWDLAITKDKDTTDTTVREFLTQHWPS